MIKSFCYAKLRKLILCCTFSDIDMSGTKKLKLNFYLAQNKGFEILEQSIKIVYTCTLILLQILLYYRFSKDIYLLLLDNLSFSNTDTRFGISLYGTQGFDSCYLKQGSSQELYCISVFCFVLHYPSFDRNAYTYQTCI